ncbi:Conserved hypothetical protein [Yarrowia lipolytica]|nr:Conserved hypothetical protein [Yarrowia lipolytica]
MVERLHLKLGPKDPVVKIEATEEVFPAPMCGPKADNREGHQGSTEGHSQHEDSNIDTSNVTEEGSKTNCPKTDIIDTKTDSQTASHNMPTMKSEVLRIGGGKDVSKYSHGDDKRGRRQRHKDDSLLFDFDVDMTDAVPITMKLGMRENSCGMIKKVAKDRDRALRREKQFGIPLNPSVHVYEDPEPGGFEDPLPDSLYEGDHKRMERDEKRVQSTERARIMEEKDRLVTQMEQLESGEWLRYIAGITKIHNMGDKEELARKRELTLKECRFMVKSYEQFKEREKQYLARKKELSLAMLNDPKYADTDLYVEKPYNSRKAVDKVSIFYHRAINIEKELEEKEAENQDDDDEDDEEEEEEVVEEAAVVRKTKGGKKLMATKTVPQKQTSRVSKPVSSRNTSSRGTPARTAPPTPPPPPPFVSFFENPKLVPLFEDMLKLRRSRRAPLAFGRPIPELEEVEFELPWLV